MSHTLCITYGCMYELDLDGQVTCVVCGSKDNETVSGYSTGKWSDDDDRHPVITPLLGPNR